MILSATPPLLWGSTARWDASAEFTTPAQERNNCLYTRQSKFEQPRRAGAEEQSEAFDEGDAARARTRKGSGKHAVFPWRKAWENRGFPRSSALVTHIIVNCRWERQARRFSIYRATVCTRAAIQYRVGGEHVAACEEGFHAEDDRRTAEKPLHYARA